MKKYKSIICLVAAVCLLGTAAFSIYHIYDHYEQLDEQTEVFDEIAEVVAQAPDEEPVPADVPVSEGQDVLSKYKDRESYHSGCQSNHCRNKSIDSSDCCRRLDCNSDHFDRGIAWVRNLSVWRRQ